MANELDMIPSEVDMVSEADMVKPLDRAKAQALSQHIALTASEVKQEEQDIINVQKRKLKAQVVDVLGLD